MIRLNNTASQFLSLITAQNGVSVVVNYSDASLSGYLGDSQVTKVTTAATTIICATPAEKTIRDIDHIIIQNTFAGQHAITVQMSSLVDAIAVLHQLLEITLSQGDSLEFTHGSGWQVIGGGTQYGPSNMYGMQLAQIFLSNGTTMPTPGADYTTLYVKTDKRLYIKDDAGVERRMLELDNAPTNSTGAITDKVGMVAFDSNYIYYCTKTYDSVDPLLDIWKRVALVSTAW